MSDGEVIATNEAAKEGVPVLALMAAVILSVALSTGAVGGALFWAIKTNRLPLANVAKVAVVVPTEPVKTRLVPMDPLLINLADPDGRSYLRVALTLKVEDVPDKDGKAKDEKAEKGAPKNPFDAQERDAALGILGKETGEELLAPDGKDRLKRDMRAVLKERVPEVKVVDVLITEFLVQR